jgi:hypothetical protein
MMRLLPNSKAINGAKPEVTYGVRIKMLLGENGDRALPEGLRMVGEEIKILQVDGDKMLTKVGDSTREASGIKVQMDGAARVQVARVQVAHGARVLAVRLMNQPTQRTMTASPNLTRRKAAMNGVKDTKFQDRKGSSNKATLGDNLGRSRKGKHKKRGASILTTKVVRVVTHGAKEYQHGVRILTSEVVKAAMHGVKVTTYGVKAVTSGGAKTLTTEVVKAVIHGVRIVTATVVKAATDGVKDQHWSRILATIGNWEENGQEFPRMLPGEMTLKGYPR